MENYGNRIRKNDEIIGKSSKKYKYYLLGNQNLHTTVMILIGLWFSLVIFIVPVAIESRDYP